MSYITKRQEKDIIKKRAMRMGINSTTWFIGAGYYYNEDKQRIVRYGNKKQSNAISFLARQGNKIVRQDKDSLYNGCSYKKPHSAFYLYW